MDKKAKNMDPKQMTLRGNKAAFNALCSEFISKLIEFKKAFNGRGSAKMSLPVGNIKDPIDKSISSLLSNLASEFSHLAGEGAQIIQEQASYSANRRKKQASKEDPFSTYNKGHVVIGEETIPVVLAITSEEQQRGLMHVEKPVPMAFTYNSPFYNKFHMKNTPAPLDLVFCYAGKVVQVFEGKPFSHDMIGNDGLSDLVLEFPYGTCASLNIGPGTPVKIIHKTSSLAIILSAKYGC